MKKYKLIPTENLIEAAKNDPLKNSGMEAFQKYYDTITSFRETRIKMKITQYDLSQRSGVPVSMISKIESGKRNPTLETMVKLASGMGKTIEIRLT